jgi:hypothetical protein
LHTREEEQLRQRGDNKSNSTSGIEGTTTTNQVF